MTLKSQRLRSVEADLFGIRFLELLMTITAMELLSTEYRKTDRWTNEHVHSEREWRGRKWDRQSDKDRGGADSETERQREGEREIDFWQFLESPSQWTSKKTTILFCNIP